MKDFGWRLDKNNSMTVDFYKTGEMNESSYVKILLRSSANLNFENNDKYCFLWSKLAYLHRCNNNNPHRVSTYKQYFNELDIDGFDFTNGFKCSDVHKFNEPNNLSFKKVELKFYQDQKKWRHKLVRIEISKHESDRVIDLLIYKNHYAFIKKLNVFLGYHHETFI